VFLLITGAAVLAHGVANAEAIEAELRNELITDLGGDE